MIKYLDWAIVFSEIPDEISLAIEITGCPHRCKNCHSPELRENIGEELTESILKALINKNPDITCVVFMGGDQDHKTIGNLGDFVRKLSLKSAMYSGDDEYDKELAKHLDYYKVGHYDEQKGPLNKKTTNQKLYKGLEDITNKFWRK